MLQYFKYNLKKKSFYFNLVLYFYFFLYKILFFFQIDILKLNIYLNVFNNLFKLYNAKFMKINTSNIFSIFSSHYTKNIFSIFKRDLFIVSTNNLLALTGLNSFLLNNLVMFSIDYYFLNIKYLSKIDIFYNLFLNNYNLLKIFIFKLFYITFNYLHFVTSKKKNLNL